MRHVLLAGLIVLMAGTAGALGQSRPADRGEPRTAPTAQGAREDAAERVRKASRLPRNAEEVRRKGVPDGEVRKALKAAKDKGVRAGEMADVTAEHSRAIDEHGPTDNFGAFVQGKLNEGLRGRELAAAIRAEHAARGKGKGAIKNRDQRGRAQDERARDERDAREKNARDREKNARDREADAREREKDARERAEKAAKAEREAREKANKGNQGKGKGKN